MYEICEGKNGRVIFAKVAPDSDLIEAVKMICKEKNIKQGYISSFIGSLKKATFVYAIPDEEKYFKISYSDPVRLNGPIELIGGQGIFTIEGNSKFHIHLHGIMSDSDMNVYGGHIVDEGNIVLATVDLIINEIKDIKLFRSFDEKSGFYFFSPAK